MDERAPFILHTQHTFTQPALHIDSKLNSLPRTEIKEWFTVRAKELESMNYTEKQIKRIILAAIRCSVE